jgi:diguanylate cyclase (GGDEF)-like protein/PAS domain S-box-containing protein
VSRRARIRAVLVVVPIGLALSLLLFVGLFAPALLDPGVPPPVLVALLVAVGGTATLRLTRVAVRCAGHLRLSWVGLAVAGVTWTASRVGDALGWEASLVWGHLRGVAFLAVGFSLLVSPGVQRTLREWGLLLLDGWLIGISIFLVGWVALRLTGSEMMAGDRFPGPLLWVPLDLVVASVVAGLAVRADRSRRVPVGMLVLASLLAVTGESTSALVSHAQFDDVQWMIMMAALTGATVGDHLDLWTLDRSGQQEPRHTRLAQVAVIPGLVAVAALPMADPVAFAAALSAILVLAVEMAIIHRQNHTLWCTMQSQSDRLDQVVRESRDAIVQVGEGHRVEFVTEAMADILGRDTRSLLGAGGHGLIHPDDLALVSTEIAHLRDPHSPGVRVIGRFRHENGSWRHLELNVSRRTGGASGFTLSARDISERVSMEIELRRIANTDALTGLQNRTAFLALLEERLGHGPAAVLFIDLDGFKAVNDMHGHAAGDRLLRETAQVLRAVLGPTDVAARLGGDEFAVLTGEGDLGHAFALARDLVDRLGRIPSGTTPRINASVGIAVGDQGSAEMLLGDADLAMYEAKSAGGGVVSVFEPGMRRRVVERARMRTALDRAGEGEGMMLLVQPIVAIADESWVGFEALVRWQDGTLQRHPAEFLPLAEETGQIVAIGTWVLRHALTWLATWPEPEVGVSVNVTGRQVATPGFVHLVTDALTNSGVSPNRLTLEITEQTAVEDLERAGAVLQPLRSLGVHVSLDDFGTGFSSLGYLARLPVDELKIDRRFVSGIGLKQEDDALVRAVIGLAADLGLRVVAEGVETLDQVLALASWGCSLAQGYHFRRPMPTAPIPPPRPVPGLTDALAPEQLGPLVVDLATPSAATPVGPGDAEDGH